MSSYTIPNVVATHPRGDRVMDVYSHLLTKRLVYLGTEIDDGVANALIAQILHLESEEPSQEIALYINSPGGSLTAAFAVYDAMQFVRSPIATTCVGQGTIPDLILQADEVIRLRAEALLCRHTGQTLETLRRDTDRDRIFTPQAAVDYGLADHLVAYRKDE